MPIKRKLTEREQKLLQVLVSEKNKTLKEIDNLMKGDVHDIKTTRDAALDNLDLSSLDENKATDWTLVKTYNERVKNIEEAVNSLARGEYGFCQQCGEPIHDKRLQALPFVRYCLKCQKGEEAVR